MQNVQVPAPWRGVSNWICKRPLPFSMLSIVSLITPVWETR
ncbi:MAG: hypothetical protein WCA01_07795 [Burkholderiales bacterium]